MSNNELDFRRPILTDVSAERVAERLARTRAALEKYLAQHKKTNTERSYRDGVRFFWGWSWLTYGVTEVSYPVPHEVILKYVVDMLTEFDKDVDAALVKLKLKKKTGRFKLTTAHQRLWALARAHREHCPSLPPKYVYSPEVRSLLATARRAHGNRRRKVNALTTDKLLDLLSLLDEQHTPRAIMLKAVLSVAFNAGGLRISELQRIQMDDVTRYECKEAPGWMYELRLIESKTLDAADQDVVLPIRGLAADYLDIWLRLLRDRNVSEGPLFRAVRPDGNFSRKGMSRPWLASRIKELVESVGLDPKLYSPHSLRAGYVTQAHRDDIPLKEAMEMSRHKSVSVHLEYVRTESMKKNKAGNLL